MQIEAHDPHHRVEADLQDKGLSHNAIGLFGGTVLGISSVAPAYALTATIGILVAEAGSKVAVVIIAGFLPMFFAAYAATLSAYAPHIRRRGGRPCRCGRSHPRPSAWPLHRSTGSDQRTQTASARTKSCRQA
jgi:hypothetical protein